MPINVLSIDLDYLIPSIDSWPSDGLEFDFHPQSKWTNYFKLHPQLEKQALPDPTCLEFCKMQFEKALRQGAKAFFGWDHDDILRDIPDDILNLVNIDHHDDFLSGCYIRPGMSESEIRRAEIREYEHVSKFKKVNEGSWGAWLHSNGKLNSFIWVGNDCIPSTGNRNPTNRYIFDNFKPENLEPTYSFIHSNQFENLIDFEFHHVFVCLSPHYTPPQLWPILGQFISTYKEITGRESNIEDWWDKKYMNKFQFLAPYDEVIKGMEQNPQKPQE